MKIKPYIDRLYASPEYKTFQKEHSNAYLTAGFFVLDLESGKHIHQIDFYVPKEKKVAAFTMDHGINMQMMKLLNSKVPEKLDIQTKIDLEALKGILEEEMKNRSITEEIKKIIAVVQNLNGKKIWNINCVLSGMGILRAHIEDESKSILKMEKASIMDYIKKMSPQELQKIQASMPPASANQMPSAEQGQSIQTDTNTPMPKATAKDKLVQLNKLEKALEKEKARVLKEETLKKNALNAEKKSIKDKKPVAIKGKR